MSLHSHKRVSRPEIPSGAADYRQCVRLWRTIISIFKWKLEKKEIKVKSCLL